MQEKIIGIATSEKLPSDMYAQQRFRSGRSLA